ncbi:MAG TPA: BNR repeat-containing protein, partial [Polyangiaceae bacterium]|nr:BNR repeat-containing protein [Polyangiaceae bacterium]
NGGTLAGGASPGGGAGAAASSGKAGAGGAGDPDAPASITKEGEGVLTSSGLTIVSYGGYLNGESFQQEGIVTYKGYQYTAFWNANRNVVMARRALPSGAWEKFDFTDYKNAEDDAHNTISLGVCPGDGTLHLSFDHHGSDLHYRRSMPGFLDSPNASTWNASSFTSVAKALVGTTTVAQVTYPRFVPEPGGKKMLFEARIGSSGSGDQYLWEYDSTTHAWTSLGKYIDGIANNINAYPHGVSYTRNGTRLHVSWCWRETPDANTNHDLVYVYSDDNGRTWNGTDGTAIGTSGSKAITLASGVPAVRIAQNRGLINQEHMAVDSQGRVHVLLSHMPSSQPDDSNFERSRTKSEFFDYWRDTDGVWHTVALGYSVVANFRGKLAISSSNNVYAILPDLRIAGATSKSNFQTFALLDKSEAGRFFSDPLIDSSRLLSEDKLTIVYPQKSSPNIYALDYALR